MLGATCTVLGAAQTILSLSVGCWGGRLTARRWRRDGGRVPSSGCRARKGAVGQGCGGSASGGASGSAILCGRRLGFHRVYREQIGIARIQREDTRPMQTGADKLDLVLPNLNQCNRVEERAKVNGLQPEAERCFITGWPAVRALGLIKRDERLRCVTKLR